MSRMRALAFVAIFLAVPPRLESAQRADFTIGDLTDFFGNEIAQIRAPFGGTVLYVVATPPIRAGEPVAMIGAPR